MANPIHNSTQSTTAPKILRWFAIGASLVLGMSVFPGLWLVLFRAEQPLWFSTLFELLALLAACFGVLAGLGRFRDGWGLTMACIAGVTLVGAVFAYIQIKPNLSDDPSVWPWIRKMVAFRIAVSAGFGLLGAIGIWSRNRQSLRFLLLAAAVLVPAGLLLGWVYQGGGGMLSTAGLSAGASAVRITLIVLGGLTLVGLVSAGGHFIIRSFEAGRIDNEAGSDPTKTSEA